MTIELFPTVRVGQQNTPIQAVHIFNAVTLASSAATFSEAVDLNHCRGKFSLQSTVTGNGKATVRYWLSNDGTHFVEPSGVGISSIAASMTSGGGKASDGKYVTEFEPAFARYMKLRFSAAAATVALDAYLAAQ